MIDLSHLTEEEQGMIMTVLRRDAELKKAEEERVRKLEKQLSSASESENKLKYLSGEWFYEAKSRRHVDTIHGSEIILASIRQTKEGSVRSERSRTCSSQGSDIMAPPKPARCLDLQELHHQDHVADTDTVNAELCSPRTPRHNPFNNASLIVEENHDSTSTGPNLELTESVVRHHTVSSQTSESSVLSENSTPGFKPVPKKRTFVSRRRCSQPDVSGLQGADSPLRPAHIVPAPRRSVQHGSSSSSNQSCEKSSEKIVDKGSVPGVSQADSSGEENSHQPLGHISQTSSHSSVDKEKQRPAVYERGNVLPERQTTETRKEEDTAVKTVLSHTGSIQESDRGRHSGSVATTERPEESLPQSIVDPDPPVSYDLKYIEKSNQQMQKKTNKKNVFKLSTQASSPTGDEDSIAKVLDWFSRSLDSLDFLGTDDETQRSTKISERHEDPCRDIRDKDKLDLTESSPQKQANVANELRATDRTGNKEPRTQEVEHDGEKDENQTSKISHLKSFWEKNNTGPKILVKDSNTSSNRGQKLSPEKNEEDEIKPHTVSEIHSVPGVNNIRRIYKEKDMEDKVESLGTDTLSQRKNIDSKYNSKHLKLPFVSRAVDRRKSDSEILCEVQSRESPDYERFSQLRETSLQQRTVPVSQLDNDVQPRDPSDSKRLNLSRNYVVHNDVQISTKLHQGSSEDANKKKECEQKNMQSDMSPKRKDDVSNKDRTNTAERIKQLKSFWEQERNKPIFYVPPSHDDGKVPQGSHLQKLNKRFTKSEYDLSSMGHDEEDTDEDDFDGNYFHVRPLNQRLEKMSPTLSTSRTQFNTLREFWDEATSETKSLVSFDKSKSPDRKELSSFQEVKPGDSNIYCLSSVVEKTRPTVTESSPSPQSRSKLQAETNGRNDTSNFVMTESKISSKDSDKSPKPQNSPGKEIRSPKRWKDTFSGSSERGNSLRRSTSMFALSAPDEQDSDQLLMDVSPAHLHSRKQRQYAGKGATVRRGSEADTLTLRARAFVPTDYRHYLGMMGTDSVHASLTPAPANDGTAEEKSVFEFDLNAPIRASTPLSSEERHNRKDYKTSQRPLWGQTIADTGQESSVSSASETWSTPRNNSTRENDDDCQNPVKKALRRAEAWPKNQTKSIEDMTSSSSSRQERNKDFAAELRRSSHASIPSPSSSLSLDPEHLKKMSKSVPSFLQQEDVDRDATESPHYEDIFLRRSSMTNLTLSSSDMASMSSLSSSLMTMYSIDFGNVDVQGNIQFSINYVQRLREFHIFVAECQDLAAVDPKRRRSDPYVKSYLVPDKANLGKRKTSVKKKTLNPKFNEILRYRVRMDYLRTQTLILSVWHHDTFGRNSFLGEVDVDLSKWDFDHTCMNYLDLKPRTTSTLAPPSGRGEMKLAIRFLPQISHSEGVAKDGPNTGEVHIWVKECRNLPLIRASIDPYVKCFVLPDTSRKSRQKTRVLRRTVDPVFNHTMVYDGISDADLTEACVELTVWDRDRLASNLLGGVRLGMGTGQSYGAVVNWMDSTPHEADLWERMMASPDEWVESVLPLRTVHSAKTALK